MFCLVLTIISVLFIKNVSWKSNPRLLMLRQSRTKGLSGLRVFTKEHDRHNNKGLFTSEKKIAWHYSVHDNGVDVVPDRRNLSGSFRRQFNFRQLMPLIVHYHIVAKEVIYSRATSASAELVSQHNISCLHCWRRGGQQLQSVCSWRCFRAAEQPFCAVPKHPLRD